MAFYGNSVSPATPGTTNDVLTITAAASRRLAIHEVSVSGLGTASAANELIMVRPSTLGITPTAQTPMPIEVDSVAAAGTCATAWTTQPVITSVVSPVRLGCNSNGGIYRWVAKPGEEFTLRHNATVSVSQASLRFTVGGSQQMGVHTIWEEF